MGFALKIALIYVVSMAALFYAGFGIARLLAFRRIQGGELLLMPFVGSCLIVSIGYWCGWLGWSARAALVTTAIVSTLFNLLALFKQRQIPLKVKGHLVIFALASMAFVLAVSSLGRSARLGPIGVNGDQVLYANVTAYLEQNGLPAPPPSASKPAIVQLSFINWGLPLGFNYLHATVDTLVKLESYETFSAITALFVALYVLAYAFLAQYVFGLGHRGTLLTALFAAVTPMLIWVHYDDFGMHVLSLSLIPLAFGLAVLALEEGSRQTLLLSALLVSGAFTSYPFAAVPFTLAPLVIYALLLSLEKRQRLAISSRRFATLSVLAVLLNLPGVLHVGKLLLPMLKFVWVKEFGNVDSYIPWAAIYGLSHHMLPEPSLPSPFLPVLPAILAPAALILSLFGVWKAREEAKRAFLALALVLIPFLLWVRFVHDYPYGYFKALTFVVFPAVIGLSLGAEKLFEAGQKGRTGRKVSAATWAVVGVLLLVNLSNSLRLSQAVQVLDLAALYRRTGKRQQAQEHLATATTMYREMNMRLWLEQAEAELTELG